MYVFVWSVWNGSMKCSEFRTGGIGSTSISSSIGVRWVVMARFCVLCVLLVRCQPNEPNLSARFGMRATLRNPIPQMHTHTHTNTFGIALALTLRHTTFKHIHPQTYVYT